MIGHYDIFVATSIFGIAPGISFMESIIKKAMSISNKGVILTCNSANHQNIQLTAKVYQSADVINLALMNGKNIDFKHYCKAIDDKDYFAMMGVLIHS